VVGVYVMRDFAVVAVYGILRMKCASGSASACEPFDPRTCKRTRMLVASANFASRILDPGGKARVLVAYAWMDEGSAEGVWACVMRWMVR
jgi:hypothetical protein